MLDSSTEIDIQDRVRTKCVGGSPNLYLHAVKRAHPHMSFKTIPAYIGMLSP
jgi:hypothetical protein